MNRIGLDDVIADIEIYSCLGTVDPRLKNSSKEHMVEHIKRIENYYNYANKVVRSYSLYDITKIECGVGRLREVIHLEDLRILENILHKIKANLKYRNK